MATDPRTWAGRVAAWQASGLGARAFAQGKGYSAAALYYWQKRLAPGGAGPRLARVVRTPEPVSAKVTDPESTMLPTAITVEIAGARIFIPPGFDRSSLGAIFDLLAGRQSKGSR